jgi:hypothetical protein
MGEESIDLTDSVVGGDLVTGIKTNIVQRNTFNITQQTRELEDKVCESRVFPMTELSLCNWFVGFEEVKEILSPSIKDVKEFVMLFFETLEKHSNDDSENAQIELNARRTQSNSCILIHYRPGGWDERTELGPGPYLLHFEIGGDIVKSINTYSNYSMEFIFQLFCKFFEDENLALQFLE